MREKVDIQLACPGTQGAPHRIERFYNLKPGFYSVTVVFGSPPRRADFRILVDERCIGQNAIYCGGDGRDREVKYTYPFVGEKKGKYKVSLEMFNPYQKGRVELLSISVSPLIVEPISWIKEEHPGKGWLDLWGWLACFSYQKRKPLTAEYIRKRIVDESGKWGANFVQFHPYWGLSAWKDGDGIGDGGVGTYEQNLEVIEYIHRQGFLIDQHRNWGGWQNTLKRRREHLIRNCRDFFNTAEKDPRFCLDGWESEEISSRESSLGSLSNVIDANLITWRYNPGAWISGASGPANKFDSLYEYNLHRGFHGPNYIKVLICASGAGNAGLDDKQVNIFYQDTGFQNRFNYVFRGYQADCRLFSPNKFGGLSSPDWIMKQSYDFFRLRKGKQIPLESSIFWLGEDDMTLPEDIREYVYIVSQDPLKSAVTLRLGSTGKGGLHFHRQGRRSGKRLLPPYKPNYRHDAQTAIIQNNHLRVYRSAFRDRGELVWDIEGTAHFDENSLAVTLSKNFLSTELDGSQPEITHKNIRRASIADNCSDKFPKKINCRLRGEKSPHRFFIFDLDKDPQDTLPYAISREEVNLPAVLDLAFRESRGAYQLILRIRATEPLKLAVSIDSHLYSTSKNCGGGLFAANLWMDEPEQYGRVATLHIGKKWKTYAIPFNLFHYDKHRIHLSVLSRKGKCEFDFVDLSYTPILHNFPLYGGHKAILSEEIEGRFRGTELKETRGYTVINDDRCLMVTIHRKLSRGKTGLKTAIDISNYGELVLDGKKVSRGAGKVPAPGLILLKDLTGLRPELAIVLQKKGKVSSLEWNHEQVSLISKNVKSEKLELLYFIGDCDNGEKRLSISPKREITLKLTEGKPKTVINRRAFPVIKLAKIVTPGPGPYFVCEKGWWTVRGAQPVTPGEERERYFQSFREWIHADCRGKMPVRKISYDYLKLYLHPHSSAKIQPYGYIKGIVRPGYGCQHTMAIKDVKPGSCTVRVFNTTPYIFAPRVEFKEGFNEVKLNGKPWHYFDEQLVFLSQKPGVYHIEIFRKNRAVPHVSRTCANIETTYYENNILTLRVSRPNYVHQVPPGFYYKALIKYDKRRLKANPLSPAKIDVRGKSGDIVNLPLDRQRIKFEKL